MTGRVDIQIQDRTGGWRTICDTRELNGKIIHRRMLEVQQSYPNNRVRAIDERNRLVDIL